VKEKDRGIGGKETVAETERLKGERERERESERKREEKRELDKGKKGERDEEEERYSKRREKECVCECKRKRKRERFFPHTCIGFLSAALGKAHAACSSNFPHGGNCINRFRSGTISITTFPALVENRWQNHQTFLSFVIHALARIS
jgi:hypothetical protein